MSNLIQLNSGIASLVKDEWSIVQLPKIEQEVKKQAGKVVLFKLTGETSVTSEQITNAEIPAKGKIIVPLAVFIARKSELIARLQQGEVGVWIDTHELLDALISSEPNLNNLPIIATHVERFADGRIFSLGNLLRTRYHYKNELRAIGDVLRDQLFFLKRNGFTSFLIRADRNAQEAMTSLNDFSKPYQGAADDARPVFIRYNRGT